MAIDFSPFRHGFNTVTKARQFDELKIALLKRAEDVCRHLYPAGRGEGNEWCVGSVNGEKGHSFQINLKTGVWKEFAEDGPGGNDLIALWAAAKDIKQSEAYDEAAKWLGFDTGKPKTAPVRMPTATPAQVEAAVKCELLDIAQQHRTNEARNDEDRLWWLTSRSTKRWDYFDGDGELWVTVCRFERPGEKVIRPWNHKLEDWKWPEGPRPLFNLQQLKTAPDPVLLVEGEKCADRLIALGYCATTAIGGASGVGKADWSPLKGRDVVRWADNDKAGAKWLEDTTGLLRTAGVKSIRDVAIPSGKPDKWDCADADDKEVDDLIDKARNAVFEGTGPFAITDWDTGVLYQGEPPVLTWLVDKTIPLGKGGLLAAQGDAGKSMILLDLAMKVCMTPPNAGNGGVWPYQALGHDVTAGGACVLLMAEDDKGEIHRRLAALDPTGELRKGCAGKLFIVAFPDAGGPPRLIMGDDKRVGPTDDFDVIRQQLRAIKTLRLIGIDPTTPFVGGDLNKPHIAGAMATMVAQLSAETGATVICTHHMTKGERAKPISSPEEARHAIRGAAAYVDGLRFAYAMWPAREDESRRIVNGLGGEFERNSVYLGSLVKINSKADRESKTFVRSDKTGLLIVRTKVEIADAKAKPMQASDEAMVFFLGLVKWHIDKNRKTIFGTVDNPFSYYQGKGTKPRDFVPMTETEWKKLASELGLSKPPNKLDIGRAAKIIVSQGPHLLCPLEMTSTGFDYAKNEG